MRLRRWAVVPTLVMVVCLPALAGQRYADGVQAFERGDYAGAAAAWQPLAEAGDPRAQYGLGLLRANGWGVTRDALRALHWYTVAAERGHPGAQYNLAVMRDRGDAVPRDAAQAAFWYGEAARQGMSSAAYNLALMILAGDGLRRDPARAMAWLERARSVDRARLIAALPAARVRVALANVRSMPAQAGEIIGGARRGRDLRVFSYRDGWAQVWIAGEQGAPSAVGWIARRLLDEPAARAATPVRLDRFALGALTGLGVQRAPRGRGRTTSVATTIRGSKSAGDERLLRNSGWLIGLDSVDFNDDADTMRVATDLLNVRAGPSTQTAVIARLGHGERVRVIGRRSGWRRIQLPEGPGSGWVASFLLATVDAGTRAQQPGRAARIGAARVNLRAAPSTSAALLGRISRGEPVRIVDSRDGWRRLHSRGRPAGWVAAFLIAGEVAKKRPKRALRVGRSGG